MYNLKCEFHSGRRKSANRDAEASNAVRFAAWLLHRSSFSSPSGGTDSGTDSGTNSGALSGGARVEGPPPTGLPRPWSVELGMRGEVGGVLRCMLEDLGGRCPQARCAWSALSEAAA